MLARQFDTPELATVVPVLALIVACDGLSTTGRAVLYGIQRFRWICTVSVSFHIAKTAMVGLLWWAQRGLVELAIGLAVVTMLQGLVQTVLPWWLLRNASDGAPGSRDPEPSPARGGLFRAMLTYSLPLLGARAAFLSGQNLSKVVLGKLFGLAELGYFSFAFQTVERFVEMVHTLPAALLPSLTRLVASSERVRLRWIFDQAFRLIQAAAFALSLVLFIFAPELTLWVGSPLFEPAAPLLRIMALVPLVRTAQQPFTMMFQAMRLPGAVLVLALIKLAVEFGCYFTLIPAVGLAGAGWANLAGAVLAFAGAHLALRRVLPEGTAERARASLLALAVLAPLAAAGLLIDGALDGVTATVAKLAIVPTALVGAFTVGLVTRYDLEKVSSVPLNAAWMRRTRDIVVAAADRLARVVALRRVT
jgi:O-antigen/teichoic acid export membrane protein